MGHISERPLRRSVVKLIISIFGGKTWRHAQDWLPGLRLQVPAAASSAGSISYRGATVAPLLHPDVLRDAATGSIHIVGSGPSISDSDLSLTAAGTCILLNGAISLIDASVTQPLAIAIEDERFVWRHFDLMRDKIRGDVICLLSTSVIRAICETDRSWLGDKRVILIDDIRKPYRQPRRTHDEIVAFDFVDLNDDGSAGFSRDPSRGVFQGGSVVISAMQFAASCAPVEIGFFGIDISNADSPRFYERAGDTAKSGIVGGQQRIIAHLSLARRICEQRSIAVSNFSAVSALRQAGFSYDGRFARD